MSTPTTTDSADFYALEGLLDDDEQEFLHRVRDFMKSEVEPTVNQHWQRGSFPFEIVPGIPATRAGRASVSRLRLSRKVIPSRRHGSDGARPHRPVDRDVLGCPWWLVDGFDLSVWQR